LPGGLTYLEFEGQPADWLPSTITHLVFGFGFNESVDHLPANLLHLALAFVSINRLICPLI
jgi:hypothetical protein